MKSRQNILNWYVFTYFQGNHSVLKVFFYIFITEKAESLLHTIPPTGSFLIQKSAGWFFVTTHGLTSCFLLLDDGESQRQTRRKQNLARRKLLSLRRNLNGSIRCRRKDRLTPKHIHIQEIRLQRISHPPVGKRKMISIFFLLLDYCTRIWTSWKNFRQV